MRSNRCSLEKNQLRTGACCGRVEQCPLRRYRAVTRPARKRIYSNSVRARPRDASQDFCVISPQSDLHAAVRAFETGVSKALQAVCADIGPKTPTGDPASNEAGINRRIP